MFYMLPQGPVIAQALGQVVSFQRWRGELPAEFSDTLNC